MINREQMKWWREIGIKNSAALKMILREPDGSKWGDAVDAEIIPIALIDGPKIEALAQPIQ